jgi:AraC-like DNA-binding protein
MVAPGWIEHFLLAPPYSQPQQVSSDTVTGIPPGTLLLVRPARDVAVDRIIADIRDLQRQAPCLTICLWADMISANSILEVARRLGDIGIRGCMVPDPTTLRDHITEPSRLGSDVAYRLEVLGFPIDATVAHFAGMACRCAGDCRDVTVVISADRASYRRLHASLVHASLGTPAKLYQVLRLVRIAVQMQREKRTSVCHLAQKFGFWDDAHLRSRFRSVLGISPAMAREWIGWERLLYWGLRRSGIHPPK